MIHRHVSVIALALATVLGLGAAGILYAQTQDRGGMMGMLSMMQDCPMMAGMNQGPAALQHRDELGLSAEQVEKLEATQKRAAEGRRAAIERMKQIHQEMRSATEGERFDEAAARAALVRMGDLHTETGLTMLRARHEARALLTAEQREKLAELSRQGMGMHGMMRMMQDCPMMRNGTGGMRMDGADTEPSHPSGS